MLIDNGIYKIEIVKDATFTLDSVDNKPYALILNPNNMKRSDYYKAFSINIDNSTDQKCIALIGSFFGSDEDVAILEDNALTVLMNATISVIDCRTLELKLHKKISARGIYCSIYKFENGYIVYGELEILKLSSNFEVEWSFSGEDVFVTQDGSLPFYIQDKSIYLTDWNGSTYIVNKLGKLIAAQTKYN